MADWIIIRERLASEGDDDDWAFTEAQGNMEQVPPDGTMFNIGAVKGLKVGADGSLLITYFWIRDDGMVYHQGGGTVTLTPVRLVLIGPERSDDPAASPPVLALHGEKRVSYGDARVDCEPSALYRFDAGFGGWTLRITDMVPPHADATRIIILGEAAP